MTFLPLLLTTTFFPKFAMSGSALVDFVRTHDGLFCSCFSFWEASLFLLFRYYFTDERPFLVTLFFVLDASSLFIVVLNFCSFAK